MYGWNIVRTHPIGKTYGRAIPAFVYNADFHFTTLDVYADGAIDCWGFVDRDLFVTKLASHWVVTQPLVGKKITVFNLGMADITDAEWLLSPADLHSMVEGVIQELNPSMMGLIDMNGDDCDESDGVRRAKLDGPDTMPFRVNADRAEIVAVPLPVLVPIDAGLLLTQWFIYADGRTQFGVDAPLLTIDEAEESVRKGDVLMSAPDGSWITIEGLGKFKTGNGCWYIEPLERIREARDELAMLQGKPGAHERCVDAHRAYELDPSETNRDQLRLAYEAVPEHLRVYCGDMDVKDWPIRRIIYGGTE